MKMVEEIKNHLEYSLIPFWAKLMDSENGGFYGMLDYDLNLDKKSMKGCILNSRIMWFFSEAYLLLKNEELLDYAKHAYLFLKDKCLDEENGGVYWSVNYKGLPYDTVKHTYNQAFAIYALAAYYKASKDEEALQLAEAIYELIEDKCKDEGGYLEAFDETFHPVSNGKLSENGVMAERTMNTLLHIMEAYTELYRVSRREDVRENLIWILNIFRDKVYNKEKCRQEVFFDKEYNSLIDLISYGHDIESAWLLERTLEVIGECPADSDIRKMAKEMSENIYQTAFDGHSVSNECEKGVENVYRIWWIQAEAMVGFVNAYQDGHGSKYLMAAERIWDYVKEYVVDKRKGSEWYWRLYSDGRPVSGEPIVEPWKCPYHNGRMCMEIVRRLGNDS